jgi:predicted ATPase
MLTRLEVKGFKNLFDTSVDFGPFTCIAGTNGVGKSNIFDAIEFLSYLATDSLMESAQVVRSASTGRAGDIRDLFWDGFRSNDKTISFAVEMLVPDEVEDDLGSPAKATTTFLRYDLKLGYSPPEGEGGIGRLTLLREELRHIIKSDAPRHLKFPHNVQHFRNSAVKGHRSGKAYLSTESRDDAIIINVHGDGGSRGKPQPRLAERARRTVLSTVSTNDYPTILAARREMQSWRRLALEPSALRTPDNFTDPRRMETNGRHLASSLYRIVHEAGRVNEADDEEAVYARVAGRLSDLTGVMVEEIEVASDPVREVFTLFLQERGGLRLPARALSEGTLRFLALCVLLEDPEFTGVLCMEEPENGIHPANITAMLNLIKDLAVDVTEPIGPSNPFRQVIVNTHSPGVVQLCDPGDLLLAETKQQIVADKSIVKSIRLTPYVGSWRDPWNRSSGFTEADIISYLTAPPHAQLSLPIRSA